MATTPRPDPNEAKALQGAKVRWDDTSMKSSYANVAHVSSTREEVVVLFGVNQAWNRGQKELVIQLTDRIILSPYAAKRLSLLLNNAISEYESRFGVLQVEARPAGEPTK